MVKRFWAKKTMLAKSNHALGKNPNHGIAKAWYCRDVESELETMVPGTTISTHHGITNTTAGTQNHGLSHHMLHHGTVNTNHSSIASNDGLTMCRTKPWSSSDTKGTMVPITSTMVQDTNSMV